MPDYPISPVVRRVVYTGSAGTGPYAFTFEVLAQTDIDVYIDSVLKTLTTDYTVTINANGTGFVTLNSAPSVSARITIVGARDITRASDYVTGGDFTAASLNVELDQQTIFNQQNAEALGRAIIAPVTDPASINMVLPVQTSRAGKILAFDSQGNPVVGEEIGNWRGNWAAGQAYTVRDLVKDSSNANVYRANTAHTSSGTTPISSNADSAKWDLVVDAASAAASAAAAAASASAAATSASNASTSASNASTSASNAASSASTATTQATNASNSATAAASSASSASSSASTATTQASNASTSATNAANSATSASNSASTATTQATNASNSASAAATSETNSAASAALANDWATKTSGPVAGGEYSAKYHAQAAATSASGASTSASNASTSATNASNSATAAASSAVSAASSAASAAALLDNFDDRYLGAKASDPALDNDGNALVVGALYFNTTDGVMKVYTASGWIAASSASVATLATFEFVATSGQTVFTGTDANGATLSYVAPALIVTLNGVRLRPGDDYTATNGTSITLVSAAALNDELVVDAFGSFLVANTYTIAQADSLLAAKVAKAGDTMTGALTVNSASQPQLFLKGTSGNGSQVQFYSNGASSNDLRVGQGYASSSDNIAYVSNQANADLILRTNAIERMRIDASGRTTIPYQPAFRVALSADISISTTSFTKITYNTIDYDIGSNFSTANNRFTAPIAGYYLFSVTYNTYGVNAGSQSRSAIYKNGNRVQILSMNYVDATGDHVYTSTVIMSLSANDYVEVFTSSDDSSYNLSGTFEWNAFMGRLLG